ncbi:MAG: hypothetical protein LBG58_12075 [Planctomycetaceae bacterium]|jgi:hypothetical protein|nr:hypothetical protein [Planctomycetaceae bacterium]
MKFKLFDVPLRKVNIKEWGIEGCEYAYVRELTTAEHTELVKILYDKGNETINDAARQANAVIRFALDEDGKRLFTEDDLWDIANGSGKPARRIIEELFAVNSLAYDAKELEKN